MFAILRDSWRMIQQWNEADWCCPPSMGFTYLTMGNINVFYQMADCHCHFFLFNKRGFSFSRLWVKLIIYRVPRCSMYGIFTYIWAIFGVNVGKYSIHGASGVIQVVIFCSTFPKKNHTAKVPRCRNHLRQGTAPGDPATKINGSWLMP